MLHRCGCWMLVTAASSRSTSIVGVLGQGYVGHVSVVGKLAARVSDLAVTDSPTTFLVRRPGHADMVSLVDMSVYRTNQQFRVAFSSKFGQHRPLLPYNKQQAVGLSQCTWSMFESTLVVCGRTQQAAAQLPSPCYSCQVHSAACPAAGSACIACLLPTFGGIHQRSPSVWALEGS